MTGPDEQDETAPRTAPTERIYPTATRVGSVRFLELLRRTTRDRVAGEVPSINPDRQLCFRAPGEIHPSKISKISKIDKIGKFTLVSNRLGLISFFLTDLIG
jgi:hypothetical protein